MSDGREERAEQAMRIEQAKKDNRGEPLDFEPVTEGEPERPDS